MLLCQVCVSFPAHIKLHVNMRKEEGGDTFYNGTTLEAYYQKSRCCKSSIFFSCTAIVGLVLCCGGKSLRPSHFCLVAISSSSSRPSKKNPQFFCLESLLTYLMPGGVEMLLYYIKYMEGSKQIRSVRSNNSL